MSARAPSNRSRTIPLLELVGCYAWSPEKVGRDVGELFGIEPLGVAATNDIDALLALKPDCVVYNPMWIDVDELVRILSAGVNVVSTASFITGHNLGAGRDRIVEACRARRLDDVRLRRQPRLRRAAGHRVGERLRPGRQGHRQRGRRHHVLRLTGHREAGRLRPAHRPPGPAGDDRQGHRRLRRGGRGWSATRSASNSTTSAARPNTPRPPPISRPRRRGRSRPDVWPASTPAGRESSADKTVVELNVRWRKGQTLEPDWKIDQRRLGHPGRRPADGDHHRRLPAAARLPGRDDSKTSWCSDTS